MRETYFLELLMKMVRAGMKSPVFTLPDGMRLIVYSHDVEITIPICKVVDNGNDGLHEEIIKYKSIILTADQLSAIVCLASDLCRPVSELDRPEKG